MSSALFIDIVTCSNDEVKYYGMKSSIEECLSSIADLRFHQIRAAQSMALGYNEGSTRGSAEWILFCHEDIQLLEFDRKNFTETLNNLDVVGVCGSRLFQSANWYNSDPSNIVGRVVIPTQAKRAPMHVEIFGKIRGKYFDHVQSLDGIFLLVRRTVLDKLLFSESIQGFTCYDVDFCYRAFLRGFRIGVTSGLTVFHDNLVSEYSEAKLQGWRENMEKIEEKFNFYRKFPDGPIHLTEKYVP